MECTGLGSRIEVVEYREGGEDSAVRKLPGRVTYPDITLKWGVTTSRELYDWHRAVINGQMQRKNGSVILLDGNRKEVLPPPIDHRAMPVVQLTRCRHAPLQ